ncbi:MAG TPA: SGNH/GDSL hydrolase family protein [Pirellulales bacterium]|nr:SGNH/GDSL hydrolase family protein [Pirellulales bacterium]
MTQRCEVEASRFVVWLPRLVTCAACVLSLGYLLHTSNDPVVLGKYDAQYATFLAVLFIVVLPALHLLARFCAVSHELKSRSGKTFRVRPRHKVTFVVLAAAAVYLSASAYSERFVNRTMTVGGDSYHPYLQNTPRPNDTAQHINRWGFRGDDLDQTKRDDVFRIFMFGGSTAYCGTVPYEQTHCRIMEKRLRELYPRYKIEVQNLGTDWHTTEHDTIKLLFYSQDFSPDLVITFHAINDLVRSLTPDMFGEGPYRSDYRHYLGAAANLVTRGRKVPWTVGAGHWCSDLRFDQIRIEGPDGSGLAGVRTSFVPKARPVQITEWNSLPAFQRNLRDFVGIARSKGMHVLLATQPALYREDLTPREQQLLVFPLTHYFAGKRPSLHSMIDGMRRFNDSTRRLAKQLNVDLVDLERRVPKTTDYLYDDVHYTPAGNELIGQAFADAIVGSKVIDRVMEERAGTADMDTSTGPSAVDGVAADAR